MDTVLVILPVFLLIFLGWFCRRISFPGEDFWPGAEKLTYFLLFPVLLASILAKASLGGLTIAPMAAAIATALMAMTLLTLGLKRALAIEGPAFTSVFQGAVRMNTYIGLSIAYGVFGDLGLAAAAVAIAVIVPIVNVLCVVMLARFGDRPAPSAKGVADQLFTNPLILGCIAGGILNLTGIGPPPVLGAVMEILSRAALPLGLLTVGAALDITALRATGPIAVLTSTLKLAVLPGLTLFGVFLFNVTGTSAFVAVLFNALPTATSAYILARQLGGDAELMASFISLQTLLAMLSLPLVLSLMA